MACNAKTGGWSAPAAAAMKVGMRKSIGFSRFEVLIEGISCEAPSITRINDDEKWLGQWAEQRRAAV